MERFVNERQAMVLATNIIELNVNAAKVVPLPTAMLTRPLERGAQAILVDPPEVVLDAVDQGDRDHLPVALLVSVGGGDVAFLPRHAQLAGDPLDHSRASSHRWQPGFPSSVMRCMTSTVAPRSRPVTLCIGSQRD